MKQIPDGVALSANQLMEGPFLIERVFAVKPGQGLPEGVINPIWRPLVAPESSLVADYEGCLSIPGHRLMVPRYPTIFLDYIDIDGIVHYDEQFSGMAARIVQHECDHLDGRTILDHAPKEVKYRLRSEIIRRRKAGGV